MKPFYPSLFFALFVLICLASFTDTQKAFNQKKQIITAADQTSKYLTYLKGKRIGMLVNQTSIIGKSASVDSLLALGVQIKKVFGPEHGFRGNASNGAKVSDSMDPKQAFPLFHYMAKTANQPKSIWPMLT